MIVEIFIRFESSYLIFLTLVISGERQQQLNHPSIIVRLKNKRAIDSEQMMAMPEQMKRTDIRNGKEVKLNAIFSKFGALKCRAEP